jgi:hypothetical protein
LELRHFPGLPAVHPRIGPLELVKQSVPKFPAGQSRTLVARNGTQGES